MKDIHKELPSESDDSRMNSNDTMARNLSTDDKDQSNLRLNRGKRNSNRNITAETAYLPSPSRVSISSNTHVGLTSE